MYLAHPLSAETLVMAAVRVVFPWSTWPMVPTFTWGFVRSNFSLLMCSPCFPLKWSPPPGLNWRPRPYQGRALPTELGGLAYPYPLPFRFRNRQVERETGLEPATFSLEG